MRVCLSIFNTLFGGRWLYMRWLTQPDPELMRAQRQRSRAPSWLRDQPKVWISILERERALRESQRMSQHAEQPDLTESTSHEDASAGTLSVDAVDDFGGAETMMVDGISDPSLTPQSPPTLFPTVMVPNVNVGSRKPRESSETELYLGPIGADRPAQQIEATTSQKNRVDLPLVLMISCLMALGLLMVYSSSIVRAGLPRGGVAGNPDFFFEQQAKFMVMGVFLMAIISRVPYQVWGLLSSALLFVGFIGLALVFSPLGKTVNGAHRWINIGINIQPIEFVKLAWILGLSLWFSDRRQDMNRHYVLWCPILALLPLIGMLGAQPDFGSALIMVFILLVTFLISGGVWRHLILPMGLIGVVGVPVMMTKFHHISRRLNDYLVVYTKPEDIEYNLQQALISFCSGRFSGVGLGQSSQKEYFLPEAHTDFILAIFGAEYGFIGIACIVGLYIALLSRCLFIARRASDLFGTLSATMIAVMFSVQAFINMAMAIGLLPTKGLTLPLVSYGGSSLLITCFSLGIILNISRDATPTRRGIRLLKSASLFHPFPRVFKFFKTHPHFLWRLRKRSSRVAR